MTAETLVFALTVLLGVAHIIVMAVYANREYGMDALVGPRDDLGNSDSAALGRARRANENFKETLPWALGLLILVQVTGDGGAVTTAGAWIYLFARVAYLPVYLLGIAWVRTYIWLFSLLGIALLWLALVF